VQSAEQDDAGSFWLRRNVGLQSPLLQEGIDGIADCLLRR